MERSVDAQRPWYHAGLPFGCTGCGGCCTGAPGYVWVRKAEIERLAASLAMDVASFEAKYVRLVGVRKSLLERRNGDCLLFDGQTRRCTVYEARPDQCRTFPFWDSNLRYSENWESACEACPGCGRGEIVPLERIESQRRIVRV
jgi:Fe-S-cluster containining protein